MDIPAWRGLEEEGSVMSKRHHYSDESRLSLHHESKRKLPGRRILKTGVASLAAAAAMTLPALAVTDRTGVVVATLTVTFSSTVPAGFKASCSLTLIGNDTLEPSETQTVTAPVSNSRATCKLTVHYSWRLDSVSSGMTIAYSVSGPIQSSSAIFETITVPADGATTNVGVAVQQ